jgi:hypothetical protein
VSHVLSTPCLQKDEGGNGVQNKQQGSHFQLHNVPTTIPPQLLRLSNLKMCLTNNVQVSPIHQHPQRTKLTHSQTLCYHTMPEIRLLLQPGHPEIHPLQMFCPDVITACIHEFIHLDPPPTPESLETTHGELGSGTPLARLLIHANLLVPLFASADMSPVLLCFFSGLKTWAGQLQQENVVNIRPDGTTLEWAPIVRIWKEAGGDRRLREWVEHHLWKDRVCFESFSFPHSVCLF